MNPLRLCGASYWWRNALSCAREDSCLLWTWEPEQKRQSGSAVVQLHAEGNWARLFFSSDTSSMEECAGGRPWLEGQGGEHVDPSAA